MIPGCLIIKFTITQNAQYRNHFHNVLCLSEAKGMDINMSRIDSTQNFKVVSESENRVGDILTQVYQAMTEKGYNPVNQIVGYIMSGDPTYITSHNNARSLIMKVERDELVEELLKVYISVKL